MCWRFLVFSCPTSSIFRPLKRISLCRGNMFSSLSRPKCTYFINEIVNFCVFLGSLVIFLDAFVLNTPPSCKFWLLIVKSTDLFVKIFLLSLPRLQLELGGIVYLSLQTAGFAGSIFLLESRLQVLLWSVNRGMLNWLYRWGIVLMLVDWLSR